MKNYSIKNYNNQVNQYKEFNKELSSGINQGLSLYDPLSDKMLYKNIDDIEKPKPYEEDTQTISFFDISKRKMGDPLLVGDLKREIGNVSGVVNVVDIRVYNIIGGSYSSSQVAQSYVDPNTKEIQQSDSTIYMKSNQIFQIRFPNTDIKIRTKPLVSTTY